MFTVWAVYLALYARAVVEDGGSINSINARTWCPVLDWVLIMVIVFLG